MDAVPVVWIAAAGVSGTAASTPGVEPPKDAERALVEWGRSKGLSLTAPRPGHQGEIAVDASLADAVEAELERAREATSALDVDGAEHALGVAEATLREHPELPEAAWLMAEVTRGWASRFARVAPKDPERAAAAWRRARGLDGGREAGLGEEATRAVDPDIAFTLALDGPGDARIDGVRVPPGTVRATAGDHQVTVTRRGATVWAAWVAVTDGATVRPPLPAGSFCAVEDLSGVRLRSGAVSAEGVLCEKWVVARPGPRDGTIFVATCAMDRCDALVEWSVAAAGPAVPGGGATRRGAWPAWATWTVVGVGVAAIAGITIGIDEAFQGGQTQGRFVTGPTPLKVTGHR